MGVPEEVKDPTITMPKKRTIGDDAEHEKKAKRKKTSNKYNAESEISINPAAVARELPNLFHMQIEELLKETRMKTKQKERLAETVEMLKDFLLNMDMGKEHKIHLQKWMKDVKLPVGQEPKITKGRFQFQAPTRVFVGGSTLLNTCVQPTKAADVFIQMPKDCFQSKDCFNHRYIRKRALYLSSVALRLLKAKVVEDAKFTYHQGNPYRPVLVVTVSGKGKPLILHLHAIPEEGVFKLSRFHITKNNVRPCWFCGEEQEDEETGKEDVRSLPSTPVYNSSILQDVCYDANAEFMSQHMQDAPSVQDGIALLKIWMHQRQLDVGYGSFSSFLMSMFVCHLLSKGLLLKSMTSYHVFRHTLMSLSKSQWLETPVSLCPQLGEGNRPTLDQFMQEFDVVFVDVTGYLNLCLGLTKSMYSRVRHEASLAMECLVGEASDHFDHLFTTPCSFQFTFDNTFVVTLTPNDLTDIVETLELSDRALDHAGVLVTTVMPSLLSFMEKGFGDRLILIQPEPQPAPVWSVTEEPPARVSKCTLTFGVLHHKSNSLRLLDRGPPANAPEANDFRQFWGEKSELRRFKDGGISEAILWASSSGLSQKRNIYSKIVTHILNRHAGIKPDQIHVVGKQMETFLHVPRCFLKEIAHSKSKSSSDNKKEDLLYGTGEERIYNIRQTLEELGKILKKLPDLSLRINSVIGIDPAFRFSEVFPAHPVVKRLMSESLLKEENKPLPLYTPAMTVICTLEASGHWPEDIDRIRDLKTLYLIDLGDKLSDFGLKIDVQETHVDVLKDGYVFRLKLGVSREIGVLRMVHSPEGMLKMEDTPESLAVEAEVTMLPELTAVLQGVQQEHPSFCATVRLVKRWMSAQLLLGQVPEVIVERTVAHLFQHPLPFTAPVSPLVGLLRFLKFVTGDEYKVEMFVDKVTATPLPVIMNWFRTVATQSLHVLQSQSEADWNVIFRPPLDVYDVVIHLSEHCLTRRHQGVEIKNFSLADYPQKTQNPRAPYDKEDTLPVTSFDPVEMFLEDLKSAYGESALFFHDCYGGDIITVLVKPPAQDATKVQAKKSSGKKSTAVKGKPAPTFDLDAMLEAVQNMGGDMITQVDVHRKLES